jgi:hypothetical protein
MLKLKKFYIRVSSEEIILNMTLAARKLYNFVITQTLWINTDVSYYKMKPALRTVSSYFHVISKKENCLPL